MIFSIAPIAAVSYGITQIPPIRKSIISVAPTTRRTPVVTVNHDIILSEAARSLPSASNILIIVSSEIF